jgi:hypothetical protein
LGRETLLSAYTDAGTRLRVAESGERGFDAEDPRRRSSSFIERGNLGVVAQAVGERKVQAVNFNVETRRGGGKRGVFEEF